MGDKNIILRKLEDNINNYKLLEKWYQQEEIYKYFEQKKLNLEEIKNKYYPRTLEDSSIQVYMIEYKNKEVGIIQYQLVKEENKKIYMINTDNCYEIDIFIGEKEYQNKGIGYKTINIISDYLFTNKKANMIVMSPLKNNINAIRCYLKSGFKIEKNYISRDTIGVLQEYVLMIKEKEMEDCNDKNSIFCTWNNLR